MDAATLALVDTAMMAGYGVQSEPTPRASSRPLVYHSPGACLLATRLPSTTTVQPRPLTPVVIIHRSADWRPRRADVLQRHQADGGARAELVELVRRRSLGAGRHYEDKSRRWSQA